MNLGTCQRAARVMVVGGPEHQARTFTRGIMSTFMGSPRTRKPSSPRSFTPFSRPTVSSSRGRAPLTACHTASQFRLHPRTSAKALP
jgi:hypothetical protein